MSIETGRFGVHLSSAAALPAQPLNAKSGDRWLADFAKLDIRDEIRLKVLKAKARRLLGI
jgi:hypothetical protein